MDFNSSKLDAVLDRFNALEHEISNPALIADTKAWAKACKERSALEPIAQSYSKLKDIQNQLLQAKELLNSGDPEISELANEEIESLRISEEELIKELKILLLPQDPNDDKNVIIEIRAGAGGDEAALFGFVLMRMYKMYADKNRWQVEDIDLNLTELGGVKEAVFSISGTKVYSKLKFESGVHRVQRVPETETQGRVHTSTVTVAVLPEIEDINVEINEKDLKIDTYRSGGAGGQHVNKTESAIRITHLPTGIVVQCQDERSQIKNREKAMKVLNSKLFELMQTKAESEYAATRKGQVGTGDRSERIRTYNYPQGRVSDHRIGMTLYSLETFLNGDIEQMVEGLRIADQTAKLQSESI